MKKLVKMIPFHCQKGTPSCPKCQALKEEGLKYCLLDLWGRGGMEARPMMQLEWEGEMVWFEYDFEKIFNDDSEALAYAKDNKIEIIED